MDSAFLLGGLPRDQLAHYYHAADILVLTSFSEGMPKVLIEGGASGLPLVSPRVSGAVEIIQDGHNGHLFPQGKKDVLTRKLLALLENEELRKKMGARSKVLIQNNFGDTTPQLLRFWQDILDNKI